MIDKNDYYLLFGITLIFLIFYFIPQNSEWFNISIINGTTLLGEYAKEHVLTCLVPALFIAGGITIFINKKRIIKYLGHNTKKYVSYSVASISGAILAVCSCTILPLFAGIKKRGAGLGPAITFLFAGPAINIAAIFLTFSVLGWEIGAARLIASILLSIVIGITMAFIFKEETEKGEMLFKDDKTANISKQILILFFGLMLAILIINGLQIDQLLKYMLIGICIIGIGLITILKFDKEVRNAWLYETWNFSKTILPLLFIGVFIAGFLMPLIPNELITETVGTNSIFGNFVASIFGAFMYFSTLTEIPILQMLISKGMSPGPALALLLAGPSLSLPNMLVIRKVLGTKKTGTYVLLVIFYSTLAGLVFGYVI
ncbi:permease [Candidatus Micrarchaeota archaeon]|nr:permease [Candidatus Micrarchaeota archaeon]